MTRTSERIGFKVVQDAKKKLCLRDFVVAPSSGGGNSSPLHDSQGVDELATLDRYHHFHGHFGLCA